METKQPGQADPSSILELSIEQIKPDPNQPRQTFLEQELDDLGDNMLRRKQLQPLLIRKDDSGYTILDGERRWRAAQRKGIKKLRAVVVASEDEAVRLLVQVTANGHRANLNPLELAQSYQQIMERTGLNATQLAKELSMSKSHVSDMLSLLSLPAEAQGLVREGKLGLVKAAAMARLDAPEQASSIARAKQGRLSRDELIGSKKKRPSSGPKRKRVTLELASGKAVISTTEKMSLVELVDFLQALSKECRRAVGQGLDIQTLVCLLHDRAKQSASKTDGVPKAETSSRGEVSC